MNECIFPTPLLPSPTSSMSAQSLPHPSPSHPPLSTPTLPLPSPLHTHPLPGCVVCCMGHWCDMHLSLQYGDTPLMWASGMGYDGYVQLLLDRGAQIDHQNEVSACRDQPSVGSQWCRKYGGAVGEIACRLLSEVGYYPPPLQSYLDLVWTNVLHVLDWCMYMNKMYGL